MCDNQGCNIAAEYFDSMDNLLCEFCMQKEIDEYGVDPEEFELIPDVIKVDHLKETVERIDRMTDHSLTTEDEEALTEILKKFEAHIRKDQKQKCIEVVRSIGGTEARLQYFENEILEKS